MIFISWLADLKNPLTLRHFEEHPTKPSFTATMATNAKENAAPPGTLALANAPNKGKSIQAESSLKQWNRDEANARILKLEREKEDLRREKEGFEKLFLREQQLHLKQQELVSKTVECMKKMTEVMKSMTEAMQRLQSENADLERQLSATSVAEDE